MSKATFDLLRGTIGLPAVISLLAAVVVGVWTCASTLSKIETKLDLHTADIGELKTDMSLVKLETHDNTVAVNRMSKKIDGP